MDSEKIPTGRMIRAARGLINMEQGTLAGLIDVAPRTIIRLEVDDPQPTNPRRLKILKAIRDKLETGYGIRFVYADKTTGEGVVMKKGR